MATDEDGVDLNVERAKIRQLQSEYARKKDQIKREDVKSKALVEELHERESELGKVKGEIEAARRRAQRDKEGRKGRKAEAETEYMRDRVEKALQDRVPIMAPDEESDDGDQQALQDMETNAEEPKKENTHNTVLVSYVNIGQDDFNVSYRIGPDITAEGLHRDACAYWGCSHMEYLLCKILPDGAAEEVYPRLGDQRNLGSFVELPVVHSHGHGILKASETAHLHLVARKDFEKFKALQEKLIKESKEKPKEQPASAKAEEKAQPQDLRTLNLAQGQTGLARPKETFVEALKDWKGIHHLLQERDRTAEQKWRRVSFADLCMYFVLVALTFVVVLLRHQPDVYLMRYGVAQTLGQGIAGQCGSMLARIPTLPTDATAAAAEMNTTTTTTTLVAADNSSEANTTITTTTATTTEDPWISLQANWTNMTSTTTTTTTEDPMIRLEALLPPLQAACEGDGTEEEDRCKVHVEGLAVRDVMSLVALVERHCAAGTMANADCNRVLEAMNARIRQGADLCFQNFKGIRSEADFWDWLGRSFHHQVFEPGSKLRQNYKPVGFLRIRQQRAKPRTCPRELPRQFERPCYDVSMTPGNQEEGQLIVTARVREFFHQSPMLMWHAATDATADLYGQMEHVYSGAGYVLEHSLADGGALGADKNLLAWVRDHWVDTQTRMLVVELTLANYNLGGYISAAFMIEISPSGAVWPSMTVLPFQLEQSEAVDVLDWCRLVLIVLYILMFRVWANSKELESRGKSGLGYVLSFEGLVDQATVAAFAGTWYMRHLVAKPPAPESMTSFRSYSQFATNYELLSVSEAIILLLLMVRLALFARFQPTVYRFWKMFAMTMLWFSFAIITVLPVFLGIVYLAVAIWSPYLREFSTWTNAFITCVMAAWRSFSIPELMHEKALPGWCIPFLAFFFLIITSFLLNVFLAITVHAYFETELLEGSDVDGGWSSDQWLDWMLWGPVYHRVLHREPGASRKRGYAEADEELNDSSSESSDEGEQKE